MEQRLHPTRDKDLLVVWTRIHKVFCGWRGQLYRNLWKSSGWLNYKRNYMDPISASLQFDYWKQLREICEPLSDVDIDYLRVLAQQKFEFSAAMFRINAVMYITVPVSALVVINQVAPKWIKIAYDFLRDDAVTKNGIDWVLLFTYAGAALSILLGIAVLFNGVYKARELRMALELEAARRRLLRGETIASAGGDTADVSL